MLAAGSTTGARAAADELSQIASEFGAPLLAAMAARADGAVLLSEGKAQASLAALRQAWTAWHSLDAPYEAARVRVLIGPRLPGARRRRYGGDGARRGT